MSDTIRCDLDPLEAMELHLVASMVLDIPAYSDRAALRSAKQKLESRLRALGHRPTADGDGRGWTVPDLRPTRGGRR